MENALIAVVAAMDDEVKKIASQMSVDVCVRKGRMLIRKGNYANCSVVLARSGIGRLAMREAAKELFASIQPSICLHVGYCGGSDPRLLAGDMLVASFVVADEDERGDEKITLDAGLVDSALEVCKSAGLRHSAGGLVTVEKAVCLPHEKADAGTRHGALALDMETFELAREAGLFGIPLVVVRAVLDPMEAELPDLGDAIDECGRIDKIALLEGLTAKPKNILSIPKISYYANQARSSIEKFVDAWLSSAVQRPGAK